jgi:arylsulfatase A-like enzyme
VNFINFISASIAYFLNDYKMNNIIKRSILFLLNIFIIISSSNLRSNPDQVNEKPNIVLLFADDLGYGDLGVFGHPTIKTPNLDRMAEGGVKLTQFYVAAPVCTPSRAALMTGRLPIRNGMCGGRVVFFPNTKGGLPQEEITIAEVLKEQNYATACIGKWHLGHKPEFLPPNQGFDYYFGIPYSNDMHPAPLILGTEIIEKETDQRLLTRRYTEHAIRFINENKENPFFLYLPYTFPHVPLYASEEFEGTSKRGLYGDVVQEIDWSVGEILKVLRANGLEENTFVFFTSDNGPWLVMDERGGSAGLLSEGKNTAWEGGMREPAIAKYPAAIQPGWVCSAVMTTLDLFPTITALGGGTLPNDKVLDGVNVMPVLKQEKSVAKDTVFYYRGRKLYALRKGPWKAHFITVIRPYSDDQVIEEHDPPLLFNVEEDPSEKYNKSEQYPEIIREILAVKQAHEDGLEDVPTRIK